MKIIVYNKNKYHLKYSYFFSILLKKYINILIINIIINKQYNKNKNKNNSLIIIE